MEIRIENKSAFTDIVKAGIIPNIEDEIQKFKASKQSLNVTVFNIEKYCEAYSSYVRE